MSREAPETSALGKIYASGEQVKFLADEFAILDSLDSDSQNSLGLVYGHVILASKVIDKLLQEFNDISHSIFLNLDEGIPFQI